MIDTEALADRLVKGLRDGVIELPEDVKHRLEEAIDQESDELAKTQLRTILENVDVAHDGCAAMCQDTGMQIFFIKAGYDFPYLKEVHSAIAPAIARATKEVPLRPNTVDPFTGENPKNNLGHNLPAITVELEEGDGCDVYIMPKGGGSENMSALWMLTPAEGFKAMKRKVLEQVQFAAGKPCPPIVLGIGIGGGADISIKLAKKALLRPLDQPNPNPEVAAMEAELLEAVNEIGVGPAGLGGVTTALGVQIEYTNRHPATFPTALVVQCWCDRRQKIHISKDGEVI